MQGLQGGAPAARGLHTHPRRSPRTSYAPPPAPPHFPSPEILSSRTCPIAPSPPHQPAWEWRKLPPEGPQQQKPPPLPRPGRARSPGALRMWVAAAADEVLYCSRNGRSPLASPLPARQEAMSLARGRRSPWRACQNPQGSLLLTEADILFYEKELVFTCVRNLTSPSGPFVHQRPHVRMRPKTGRKPAVIELSLCTCKHYCSVSVNLRATEVTARATRTPHRA